MKSIRYCLNKQLAEICQHSLQLEGLTEKISTLLPAELVSHCKVSSFNKGCLILEAIDAAWASQIRYAIPELRDQLRTLGMYQLSSIKVTVSTAPALLSPDDDKKVNKTSRKELTDHAKASIIRESESCTYEPLRKALLNLAD